MSAAAVSELLNAFLLVYAGLFPIVNPIGGAPIFLGFTRHCTEAQRHSLAARVAVNGFFLLLGSLLVGAHVLEFFGITLPVVRVAGGLVVVSFAWKLLQSGDDIDPMPAADPSKRPAAAAADDAFYPLTMPLTVGPGSIAVAISLGSQRPLGGGLAHLALVAAAAVAGLAAVAATVFVCYRFAEPIIARLGESGTNVFVRLSAFILLCIGIEIVWSGYTALTGAAGG